MGRPSLVVVLAEDEGHQRFVRNYLYRAGLGAHAIRFLDLPSGRGCGEQWVRDRYANAVKQYRSRAAKAESALIVAIDADNGDVGRRVRQLEDALTEFRLGGRADEESIAHLVPKRNIETWVLFLTGTQVDEDTDYRRRHEVGDLLPEAGRTFFDHSRSGATLPVDVLPSLLAAFPEARRVSVVW